MSSIIAELHDNSIITSDAVMRLKSYIAGKSPDVSVARRAVILADAMNKVIDARLPKFEEVLYGKMKKLLLEHTAKKPAFDIHCSDVFQAAIELKESGEHFFEELDTWLSANLERKVPREQLIDVVLETHEFMMLKPEMSFPDMISAAESAIAARSDLLEKAAQRSAAAEAGIEAWAAGKAEANADEAAEVLAWVPAYKPVSRADEASEPYAVLGYFSGIFERRSSSRTFILKKLTNDWKKSSVLTAAALMFAVVMFLWVGKITDGASQATMYPQVAVSASDIAGSMTVLAQEDLAAGSNSSGEEQKLRMKATAYDLSVESCGKLPGEPGYGITSSGRKAEVGRTVAVDPEVIPLGSRLRITFPEEYSHLDGIYVAEDTGRLIKGSSIDIFFGEDNKGSTSINEKAMNFGVRYVEVTILDNTENSSS